MNANEAVRIACGSMVVYLIMAACANGQAHWIGTPPGSDASDGTESSGANRPDDGSATITLDALTDPVGMANAAPEQSGSRLKAKYYVGSDGSRQFLGWHDSMLNVDCAFYPASDGTTRCMPAGTTVSASVFSDPGCSQPLAETSKGCAPGKYELQLTAATACASNYYFRLFEVGAIYSGPLYSGTPGSCTEESDAGADSLRAAADIYELGSEIPPSTFVAVTVQTDP